ncbi:MAG: NYN domain-containing protein [Isosphaeraceae bacterium]|nr:NYN domain-containing protein [Isosphaeraceae bacterium]
MQAPRLLIDGMNVIGATPDGWWRDRDAAVRRLVERLRPLAASGEPITLVLDGPPLADLPEGEHGGIEVLYARRGGANAADDRIVELVSEQPRAYHLITSDRTLRARVEALGGTVAGVSALRRRLDSLGSGPS